MTRLALVASCVAFLVLNGPLDAEDLMVPSPPGSAQFESLFNGTDLTGWDGDEELWSVKEGVIHGETTPEKKSQGNTFLIWKGGNVKDFELQISFRCNATNNSGFSIVRSE